jgi:hypothetical protein
LCLQASHDIKKQRLGPGGAPVSTTEVHNVHQTQKKQKDDQNITCGSCYGAESEQYKCCNTCDDVSASCHLQQHTALPARQQLVDCHSLLAGDAG